MPSVIGPENALRISALNVSHSPVICWYWSSILPSCWTWSSSSTLQEAIVSSYSFRPVLNSGSRSRQLFPNSAIEYISWSPASSRLAIHSPVIQNRSSMDSFESVKFRGSMAWFIAATAPIASSLPCLMFLTILSRAARMLSVSVSTRFAVLCIRCSSSTEIPYCALCVSSSSAHCPTPSVFLTIASPRFHAFRIAPSIHPVIVSSPSFTFWNVTPSPTRRRFAFISEIPLHASSPAVPTSFRFVCMFVRSVCAFSIFCCISWKAWLVGFTPCDRMVSSARSACCTTFFCASICFCSVSVFCCM